MPAVTSGKVLVTGANGFIAIWIVDRLLRQGYAVRAAVRSADKGEYIKKTFATYGDKLEIAIVGDMSQEGAFDNAVQGVDAIEHTASPATLVHAGDPDELILPAVNGALGILKSAAAYGSSVKRIIFTSSSAAILTQSTVPRVYNETDWNDAAVQEVREKGRDAVPRWKYRASKVLAERAVWDFYTKNKATISWDLVVINPTLVFGPVLHAVSSLDTINETMRIWHDAVLGGTVDNQALVTNGVSWVDVRDVADAHCRALSAAQAADRRLIVVAGNDVWQEWINAAVDIAENIPAGNPSYDPEKAVHLDTYDMSKSNEILGIQYRTVSETTRDILEDFQARGWLN